LVCFIDDDNIIIGEWAKIIRSLFEKEPKLAILGSKGSLTPTVSAPWWWRDYEVSYACGEPKPHHSERESVYGAGMTVRKNAFIVGGKYRFKQHLYGVVGGKRQGGEDVEMCLQARLSGWSISWTPELEFIHNIAVRRLTDAGLQEISSANGISAPSIAMYRMAHRGHALASHPELFRIVLAIYCLAMWMVTRCAYAVGRRKRFWGKMRGAFFQSALCRLWMDRKSLSELKVTIDIICNKESG
jgi:GT2 family glycosyltransferase